MNGTGLDQEYIVCSLSVSGNVDALSSKGSRGVVKFLPELPRPQNFTVVCPQNSEPSHGMSEDVPEFGEST